MTAKIHIIGIGSDGSAGLTAHSRQTLASADLVLGSADVLGLIEEVNVEKAEIGSNLKAMVQKLQDLLEASKRVVLLAIGDPLFYGVARYLCDRIGKEHFEVHPHVSSMQLAFARIKESWEEAYLVSLAAHPLDSVMDRIRIAETVGLFTTEEESPARIAKKLLGHGIDYFDVSVCENLGAPDERVTQAELREIAQMEFSSLNVVILKRQPDRPDRRAFSSTLLRFGNSDQIFEQSRPVSALITQSEVRCLALAQMQIHPGDVIWDVGAGSGSVAIEASRLSEPGLVYAIEQDVADHQLLTTNMETFGVRNLRPVLGTAPQSFVDLPVPDAIFVGGTGQEVSKLLASAYHCLRKGGRLVVHLATLEGLNAGYGELKKLSGSVQVIMVNLARGTEQLSALRFEAVNPTFLLSLTKAG